MEKINKIKSLINKGEIIILPTDTVYGLLCRYNLKEAVEKIYKIKKRERNKPLILLGYSWKSLKKFVDLKNVNKNLLKILIKKWPGPTTLVLPASKLVPEYLNKGFKTVGIRVPKSDFLLKVLKKSPDKVLASTSANISGKSHKSPQKSLLKKVKFFKKAKKNEMSLKPSEIIILDKSKIKKIRYWL